MYGRPFLAEFLAVLVGMCKSCFYMNRYKFSYKYLPNNLTGDELNTVPFSPGHLGLGTPSSTMFTLSDLFLGSLRPNYFSCFLYLTQTQTKFIPHQDFTEETTSRGKGRKMKARNQAGLQCRADWTWEIMKYASP